MPEVSDLENDPISSISLILKDHWRYTLILSIVGKYRAVVNLDESPKALKVMTLKLRTWIMLYVSCLSSFLPSAYICSRGL